MLSHQEARRNLSPGELIYANSMIAEEIAAENKAKRLSTLKQNQIDRSVQMDKTEDKEKSCTSPTHTRVQVAKMSGVGAGTMPMKRTLDFSNVPVYNQDRSESDAKSDLPSVKLNYKE